MKGTILDDIPKALPIDQSSVTMDELKQMMGKNYTTCLIFATSKVRAGLWEKCRKQVGKEIRGAWRRKK